MRSIAMIMIVICHLYGYAIASNPFSSEAISGVFKYLMSEFLVICCSVCVNVFILISSFFSFSRPLNLKRIMLLWFQVVFYTFILTTVSYILRFPTISWKEIIRSLFPITTYAYWFCSVYFGFVFIVPFLSKLVMALSRKEHEWLLLILIILCCTFSHNIPLGERMGINKGFSLLWFIALFFWGSFIKRFEISLSKKNCYLLFLASVILVLLLFGGKALFMLKSGQSGLSIKFPTYNGFSFPLSLFLFLAFKKTSFKKSVASSFLIKAAPFSFGVYLISEHPFIRPLLWQESVPWLSLLNSPWLIPVAILFCLCVFLLGTFIDWLRYLFFSIIRLPDFAESVSNRIARRFPIITTFPNSSSQEPL